MLFSIGERFSIGNYMSAGTKLILKTSKARWRIIPLEEGTATRKASGDLPARSRVGKELGLGTRIL